MKSTVNLSRNDLAIWAQDHLGIAKALDRMVVELQAGGPLEGIVKQDLVLKDHRLLRGAEDLVLCMWALIYKGSLASAMFVGCPLLPIEL